MLILTRKAGESVTIGQNIKIKIIGIEQNQVKIGFEAPLDIGIFRDELIAKVKDANISASTSFADYSPGDLILRKK